MNTEPNKDPAQSATSDKVIVESRSKGAAEEGQSRPKPRGYGLFSGLSIGAFLLGIVAVSVGVFLWYSLAVTNRLEMAETVARAELIAEEFDLIRTAQRSLIAEQITLFRTIDENRNVLEDKLRVLDQETRTSLLNQDKQQNDLTDQLLVEVDVLARSMESAHQELSRGSNEWLLEEILQLINLANERLLLVGDLSLAIRALKIAEDRIADLSDPALLAVRRQLVSDISVLGNIPIADINGAVLNLSMLMAYLQVALSMRF